MVRHLHSPLPHFLPTFSVSTGHLFSPSLPDIVQAAFYDENNSTFFCFLIFLPFFSLLDICKTTRIDITTRKMVASIKTRPPRLEIEDLEIQESDPRYAAAVRCVRIYWKQATRLTCAQRTRFLGFLKTGGEVDYLSKTSVTSHILYTNARNYQGKIPTEDIRWSDYMFLLSLYGNLPADFVTAVTERYYSANILDFTEEYRSYYPEPTPRSQEITTESIKTRQPINIDLTQNNEISNKKPNASRDWKKDSGESIAPRHKENATHAQKIKAVFKLIPRQHIAIITQKDDEVGASTSQQQDNIPHRHKNVVMPTTLMASSKIPYLHRRMAMRHQLQQARTRILQLQELSFPQRHQQMRSLWYQRHGTLTILLASYLYRTRRDYAPRLKVLRNVRSWMAMKYWKRSMSGPKTSSKLWTSYNATTIASFRKCAKLSNRISRLSKTCEVNYASSCRRLQQLSEISKSV